MIRQLFVLAALTLAPDVGAQTPQEATARELHALFDEAWERGLRESPPIRSSLSISARARASIH